MGVYITSEELKASVATYVSASFKFSDKVREISMKKVQHTTAEFNFLNITTGGAFDGKNQFLIYFDSDTQYRVYHTKTDFYSNLYRGSSDINADFDIGGEIFIPAGTFGANFTHKDEVTFSIDGLVSSDELEDIIFDAETEIDLYTKARNILDHDLELDHLPLFLQHLPLAGNYKDIGQIPMFGEIKVATKQMAVSMLIERNMLPVTMGADLSEGFNISLRERALRTMDKFLDRYKLGTIHTVSTSTLLRESGACAETLKELYRRIECDRDERRRRRCGC